MDAPWPGAGWPLAWPLAGPWPGPWLALGLALGWPLAWPLAGPWPGPWLALDLALGWPLAWPLAGPVQTSSSSNWEIKLTGSPGKISASGLRSIECNVNTYVEKRIRSFIIVGAKFFIDRRKH